MKIEVIKLPPARVACMRHIGPYGPQLGTFWRETFWPWMQANGIKDGARYGIGLDDPRHTDPEQCRYDACIEVPENFSGDGRATVTTLPGGQFAAMHFTGTGATIGDAWKAMFTEWLPKSGLHVIAGPALEYYPADAKSDATTGAFECLLCVPIKE